MPKLLKKALAFCFSLLLLVTSLPIGRVSALISSCGANVSLTQVNPGVMTNFGFSVDNTSGIDIVWVRITRPSTNFTLTGASVGGWTKTVTNSSATFTGLLDPGGNKNFTLTGVQVANVQAPSANWLVEVSDDSLGSNPTTCTGTLGTQIGTIDTTPPVISNIQVSNITATGATITWTTNEPASSKVDYGLTGSYGSTANNSTFVTSHSIDLTNLTSNTGYHYRVSSSDPSNNSTSSSDNTFLTLAVPVITNQNPNPISNINSSTNQVPETKKPISKNADQTAPTIVFKTPFNIVYKDPPVIEGTATDNVAVSTIEISTDSGANWLPVSDIVGLGSQTVNFKFKLVNLPDDNYLVKVRVTDSSGNIGVSTTQTLIIDKIPPVIGPSIVSVGPQIVTPVGNVIHAAANVDQKITLSTIGGSTSVIITAQSKDKKENKSFTLSKPLSSDLWSGILAFDKEGSYALEAKAVDGANNKTSRNLNAVFVDQSSRVVSKTTGKGVNNATITLYYFDQETTSWVVWDGLSYGEKNPQVTASNGNFNFYVPEGKYYLKATAPRFQDFTSEIFLISKSSNLSVEVALENLTSFKIGNFILNLPRFSLTSSKLKFNSSATTFNQENSLVGKDLPNFEFTSTEDQKIKSINLLGKDTLITFLATWDPRTEEQISQLEELISDPKYNLIRINPLEALAKLKSYKKIAGYKGDFLADEKGASLSSFQLDGLPLHVFVSKAGKIKKVSSGVLTRAQLIYNLDN